MRKNLYKVLTFALIVAMLLSTSAFADSYTSSTDMLETLADSTIQVSQKTDESGAITTIYDNLEEFIALAHENDPNLSDIDLAEFILNYTNQEYEGLTEECILEALGYKQIATSSQYLRTNENGNVIVSNYPLLMANGDYTSPDGYMNLQTTYSLTKTVNSNKYYSVVATAKWLRYPAVCIEDGLTLGTNANFDDSYNDAGCVYQTFKCNSCGNYTYRDRSVTTSSTVDDDLTLNNGTNFLPYLTFSPLSPTCDHCSASASVDSYFIAQLRCGIVTTGIANVQAGYSHETVGVGGLSVVVGASGVTPSFSGGVIRTDYIARACTIS